MLNAAIRRIFKDETSAFIAMQLEIVLERMVPLAVEITKKKYSTKSLLFQRLENRAVPIIWEILQTMDPEVSESVREIDGRVIWTIYWRLKSNPANKHMSFFCLLVELNKNLPFAMYFG
jgi:hypothetical protein